MRVRSVSIYSINLEPLYERIGFYFPKLADECSNLRYYQWMCIHLEVVFIIYIVLILCVAVRVRFYTLFERKILGSSHNRLGPSIVRMWGILQPFSDALKLFTKEQSSLYKRNYFIYVLRPGMNLTFSFLLWASYPLFINIFNFKYSLLVMIVVIRVSIYSFLGIR